MFDIKRKNKKKSRKPIFWINDNLNRKERNDSFNSKKVFIDLTFDTFDAGNYSSTND